MPDLRQSCVEAGARALRHPQKISRQMLSRDEIARAERALDAILPVLAEAVEGMREPTALDGDEREFGRHVGHNRCVDAVLALLADVQGDGDA